MAYTPHKWMNGEVITAEKMNDLEDAAAQAAQPGPKGEKGEPGKGLTGEVTIINHLPTDADANAVAEKVNEIITVLIARGISADAEGV